MDSHPHSLLCALWYPRRLCWWPAGFRWGFHPGPASPRDRSHPPGRWNYQRYLRMELKVSGEFGNSFMCSLFLTVYGQVASATATFVMMYSSSLSVVEFYLLKRFPIPYGT